MYKKLAERAEATGNKDVINFVRKFMLNEGEDPNEYFSEQRKTLTGETIKTKIRFRNG